MLKKDLIINGTEMGSQAASKSWLKIFVQSHSSSAGVQLQTEDGNAYYFLACQLWWVRK